MLSWCHMRFKLWDARLYVLSCSSVALSSVLCNLMPPARRITLEAPPVRSWEVDGLLDSLVAPTLPPADKSERARRQGEWERQATATTKVIICDAHSLEMSTRRQPCARSSAVGHTTVVGCELHCDSSMPQHTRLSIEKAALGFEDVQLRIQTAGSISLRAPLPYDN